MSAKSALVTGSAGLIGSASVRRLLAEGYRVTGIDNNLRQYFFGADGSTLAERTELTALRGYEHVDCDVRDRAAIEELYQRLGPTLKLVVHAAAQPSHDWAAREPQTDFGINATGTLNLLEAHRAHSPEATFVFLSTNKVYGDAPNRLPMLELEQRWEVARDHPYFARGIDESMSIDQCTHSLFGVSKVAADLMVQEYGRYFGLPTVCLRGGCLTGPAHAAAQLHGFLAYLMKCCVDGTPYVVCGYKAKQVRDNIHSDDLVSAILAVHGRPQAGAVYNMGGGRANSCSMLEAIALCERISGRQLTWSYSEQNRIGDHVWWISDTARFERDYPGWGRRYDLPITLAQILEANRGPGA